MKTEAPVQRVGRQYRIGSPLLLLFSAPFIVWQIGILYYSGDTMSLFGRTPVPLTDSDTALVIAAGYIVSIAAICLFPRRTVYMERALMPVALAASVLMLFPLPPAALTVLFCTEAFVCVFSIGTMLSVAVHSFTAETTWRDGIISMVVGGVLIAALQNEVYRVSFTVFMVFSVLLVAAQTAFYYLIPAKIEVPYAGRGNWLHMPKLLFIGIWLISGFATLLICFASSYAESVPGGVSTLYLSAAALALLLYFLRKRLGARSVRVFGGFFALSVLGFVLAFLSLQIPALRYIACVLLGLVVVLANLWVFFSAVSFQVYPTRFVGAMGAAMGLALAAFHSGLQTALRDSLPTLYGVYAALSVVLLLVYFFLEPYFIRIWNRERAPEPDASAAAEPHPFDALSEQERILAELILAGHTETSAARAMNISLNTEKGYRKNIYFKLDIHTKRELFELVEI